MSVPVNFSIFNDARGQILECYHLTDEQTKDCLFALACAEKKYENTTMEYFPQNIMLQNQYGTVLHKIVTKEGKLETVFVKCPSPFWTMKTFVCAVGVATMIGATVCYLVQKKNKKINKIM